MELSAAQGRRLVRRTTTLGAVAAAGAHTVAAILVYVLLVFVLPLPDGADRRVVGNLVLTAIYGPIAVAVGLVSGLRRAGHRLQWLREGRVPDDEERAKTLGLPLAITRVEMQLWVLAAIVFGAYNITASVLLGAEVVTTVLIGGFVASTLTYLLVERVNRPILAEAMADAPLDMSRGAGVTWRAIGAWLLGTALPVAGLVLLNGLAIGLDVPRRELATASFVLGLVAITIGFLITLTFARSVADPLKSLRRAVASVAQGDTSVRVPVTDATEVGVLQTGFNRMVAGLAERDHIRELFGRHVGEDIAQRALEQGVELGGEIRDVAVLFVDVTGSTGLAEDAGPVSTVERLNHLFGLVLDVVEAGEGTVTTFAGDAAVCVWGAPLSHPSAETAALAAARDLAAAIATDRAALPVGIGVAGGPVVAGNVGARQRIEYTVIGDAVNRAARLCDLAKDRPGCVLADADVVERADDGEQSQWTDAGEEVLRGRRSATRLAVPLGS